MLRRNDLSVIGLLFEAPQRFACFQALRLLLAWLAEHGVTEDTALANIVRFDNSVSMTFPASQIEALATAGITDTEALLQALLSGQVQHLHITPAFMGLLGSHGVLPSHYSERIAAHENSERDASPRALLDLFSSRAIALFYRAWSKYRVEHGALRQAFLPCLLSLAGCQSGNDDHAIGLYSGLLQQRNVSSVVMARILGDHFGVPFHVHEASGGMTAMVPREQTALGGANALLGQRAIMGERCHRPDLAVRLRIGPLTARQYASFLPRAQASVKLRQMLMLFSHPLLRYDIVLVLHSSEVQQLTLAAAAPGRLGCNSFLGSESTPRMRDDMHYAIQLMPSLNN